MKTQEFQPTHRITLESGATVEVMLVDGAAYTREEWDAEVPADWERDGAGGWTFQGRLFAGRVEAVDSRRPILGGMLVAMTADAIVRWNAGETTDRDLRESRLWKANDDGTGEWITLRRATNSTLEPEIAKAIADQSIYPE